MRGQRQRRGGVTVVVLGLLLAVSAAGSASAGITAQNQPDGRCQVVASLDGVAPWEMRLERWRGGRWVVVGRPFTWTLTRATFACSAISRARIRARGRAGDGAVRSTAVIHQPTALVPQVRIVYAAPADRALRDDFAEAIGAAAGEIQQWYAGQLGRSFRISRRGVERCTLRREASYYAVRSYPRVLKDLGRCAPVTLISPGYTWLVYVDVDGACGKPDALGVGARGLAIMPRHDLDGLIGAPAIDSCGAPIPGGRERWVGGAAHELGHGFGLIHPPACDRRQTGCDEHALMWNGYAEFPASTLTPGDRRRLLRSRYFTTDWR